jgi:hypothetical protein
MMTSLKQTSTRKDTEMTQYTYQQVRSEFLKTTRKRDRYTSVTTIFEYTFRIVGGNSSFVVENTQTRYKKKFPMGYSRVDAIYELLNV